MCLVLFIGMHAILLLLPVIKDDWHKYTVKCIIFYRLVYTVC